MKTDHEEVSKVAKVHDLQDYYSITTENGIGFGLDKIYGVEPKHGDDITIITKDGAFGTIRGVNLNGKVVFYKTDEQLEQEHQEWLKKNEEEKLKRFEENKARMDAQYEKLPQAFKDRIDKYRANNPKFRIDFEDYELFCCEQAVIIANACKTADEVAKFREKDWDDQIAQVPDLSSDHSGNTFGCACALAHWYLEKPENVAKMFGAMSPLVGSKEYGDSPKEEK